MYSRPCHPELVSGSQKINIFNYLFHFFLLHSNGVNQKKKMKQKKKIRLALSYVIPEIISLPKFLSRGLLIKDYLIQNMYTSLNKSSVKQTSPTKTFIRQRNYFRQECFWLYVAIMD